MNTDNEFLFTLAKGKKVLLIEDDTLILNMFQVALEAYFSLVKTAVNGKEGWELYRKEHFDLVISDIEMPFTNGVTLSKGIKAHNPEQTILITSAHTDEKYLLELIDIGVDGFLKKPINASNLKITILKVLKKIQAKKELERLKFHAYVKELSSRDVTASKSHIQSQMERSVQNRAKESMFGFMEKLKVSDPEKFQFFNTQKELILNNLYDLDENFEMFIFKKYQAFEYFNDMIHNFYALHESLKGFKKIENFCNEVLRLSDILSHINIQELETDVVEELCSILEFLIDDIRQYILELFVNETFESKDGFEHSLKENISYLENLLLPYNTIHQDADEFSLLVV